MIRYVLALLLINVHSRSLGAPQPNPMIVALGTLAQHCENRILAAQIENRTQDCSESAVNKKKNFECLIFYDINSQLCTAIGSSKITIIEDNTTKINQEQDVKSLCEAAKDWKFTKLTDKFVNNIFENPMKCAKVCGVDDVLSVDSSFYCKYFKWGWDLLKTQVNNVPQVNPSSISIQSNVPNTAEESKKNYTITTTNDNTASQPKSVLSDPKTSTLTQAGKDDITLAKNEDGKQEEINTSVMTSSAVNQTEPVSQTPRKVTSFGSKSDEHQPLNAPINSASEDTMKEQTSQIGVPEKDVVKTDEIDKNVSEKKDEIVNTDEVKKEESKNDNASKKDDALNVNAPVENSEMKPIGDTEDYQANDFDMDEGKDGLPETDANNDQEDPVLTDLEVKGTQDQKKTPVNRIEPPISAFNGDMSQREFYPNTIPEDFEADDDHFFPFFLTAIILVVLLYVLYHNKSKVTKVFLGLIVEGRQGRRRNSRGHAYRRLDTLEQAMSGNLAAPPSKIIY